ncbi:MAG: hypothetical protein EA396_09805 [Anaerolineaceae bacterium]|nr:MAG: hypothetical protein EA396_09805 [Anaerolineaceae bacterium]
MQPQVSLQDEQLRRLLRFVQIVSVLGFLYSIAALTQGTAPNAAWLHVLYTSWFLLAIVSAQAVIYRLKAGAITLAIGTIAVMIGELVGGVASIGGASLGLFVAYLIIAHIRPIWGTFE